MFSAFPSRFVAALIGFGACAGLHAQSGGFLQRQQPDQGIPGQVQDGIGSGVRPAYCAEPANASLMECGNFPTGRVPTGPSGGGSRTTFPGMTDSITGMRVSPESRDGANAGTGLTPEIGRV